MGLTPKTNNPKQMSFFKKNYEQAESAGNYLKIQPNETVTLRIITAPVEGLQIFDANKPVRWQHGEATPEVVARSDEKPRQFAALGVWHYESGTAKIWVCTTKSVLLDIQNIIEMEGHPFSYDIQVIRKGANLQTRYFTKMVRKSEAEEEVKAAAHYYSNEVDLRNLFTGANPFEKQPTNTQENGTTKEEPAASAPF